MKVVRIFELSKEKLYSVEFDTDERHAVQILQDEWEDQIYLYEFFKQWKEDYRKFYGSKKTADIVEDAINDADELFESLLDERQDLNKLFKPLDNREAKNTPYDLQELKAKTFSLSFLRIYGIRYGNTIIVTGGAIKLTGKMGQREHTKIELKKLEIVKAYLKDDANEAEFVYLEFK
ncbi:MAG: hypothetical protein JJ978_04540 [Roseivirga sp.]|jgi:hypothetical protein|uniref:hypothetical protein n=1 Tax=Roseivirga sp. TaxID=1964215 RepID=UPI001B1B2239|nr:hypothetical protein [Roseivirga sp.]MBO6494814.1 hypothetical protein [Roseivirga sp.]